MGMILGAWPLVYIFSSLPCGALLDKYGSGNMLAVSATIIAISMLLRGFAESYVDLLISMFLFGIAAPLISSGAPKVISTWFIGKERGLGTGLYFSGNALGGIAAISLTNSFFLPILNGDWRRLFFLYAFLTICAGLLWLILSQKELFKRIESDLSFGKTFRYSQAIKDLLSQRLIRIVVVMGLFILFFNHGLVHWLPTILIEKGMTSVEAGYWSSIPSVVGLLSAPFINRLATPNIRYKILLILFSCAGFATIMIYLNSSTTLIIGLILQGMCRGAMNGITILIIMDNEDNKDKNVGAAVGLYWSIGEVGGALGPAAVGTLADITGSFNPALFMMLGVSIILIFCIRKIQSISNFEKTESKKEFSSNCR